MSRERGRPSRGEGIARGALLDAALALLDEGGGKGLTMRALAARLGITPMGLYHHIVDRAGLLRALSDRVYDEVLTGTASLSDPLAEIRTLLVRYHGAVGRHPQLTLAIFTEPAAFAGASRRITERLTFLLSQLTPHPVLWRDILVDHAHGSGLAVSAARADAHQADAMEAGYRQALDRLLEQVADARARDVPAT